MAEHKAKDKEDDAPPYPAPPMTDADIKASDKHAVEEVAKAEKSAPKKD